MPADDGALLFMASQSRRDQAERVAASVPNVKQVVNDLQVKNQKATSSQ